MRRVITLPALMALAGCALAPHGPTMKTKDDLLAQYSAYANGPVAMLANKLGAPSGESRIGGTKAYLWEAQANLAAIVPGSQPIPLQCELQVFVDDKDTIRNVFMKGQDGACQQFDLAR